MPHDKKAAPRSAPQREALRKDIEQLAAKYGMGVDEIARFAAAQAGGHTAAQQSARQSTDERRLFPRYAFERSAVAQICEENRSNRYVSCTITDLSFSGVQVLFPSDLAELFMDEDFNGFELLFSLPEKNRSVCLRCRLVRIRVTPEHFVVGATCEQSQLEHLQSLQRTPARFWCIHPDAPSSGTN